MLLQRKQLREKIINLLYYQSKTSHIAYCEVYFFQVKKTFEMNIFKKTSYLLFFVFLIQSCAKPKDLTYQGVRNFHVTKISLERPEVGMDVLFFNPNNFSLTIKNINLDVLISGKLVGKITMETNTVVPANATFALPISLETELKRVLPNAMQLLLNKEVEVELRGAAKAGKGVYISLPINHKEKVKLDLWK